jgi:hypothetical protein
VSKRDEEEGQALLEDISVEPLKPIETKKKSKDWKEERV